MFDSVTPRLIGLATAALVAVAAAPTTARSQNFEYDTALRVAEEQVMMTERMVGEALFVALEFESASNLARLERSRNQFGTVFNGFVDKDGEIGMRLADDPEALRAVAEAEEIWQAVDDTIGQSVAGAAVTAEHVESLVDLSDSLRIAVIDLADGLRQSAGPNAHGMLENAIQTAVRVQAMSQQMTKEFLLVAYGHQPNRYRTSLRSTADDFEVGLRGLLQGDFDQLLLPAPNPEIQAQLERVDRVWQDEYRPLIDQAIDRQPLDEQAVARMSQANRRLLRETGSAATLYRNL